MIKLSVVIITFNEEKNIARCLDSVKAIADDIVIVDSHSSDKTEEIALARGARFFKNAWPGYSKQKNYGADLALYDFVFSIDADEVLNEELKKSVIKVKQNSQSIPTLKIKRLTNYCGKWIKHCGWYPDKKVRFYDKTKNHWTGSIHERINVDSEKDIPTLEGDCLHYTYYNIEEHILQANKFSTLSAIQLFEKGKKVSIFKIIFSPIFRFIGIYIIKGGFLDGYEGFLISKISANATFLKYIKHKELVMQASKK